MSTQAPSASVEDAPARWRVAGAMLVLASLLLPIVLFIGEEEANAVTPRRLLARDGVGEYQPSLGSGFIAWQQNLPRHPNHYNAYVRAIDGARRFRVNAPQTSGALGDIDDGLLAVQQFGRHQSDLRLFDLSQRRRTRPPAGVNTGQWEYWPSLSGDWLLFGRFDRPGGARQLILFNLGTGNARTLDTVRRGALWPGQVNGDWVVWQACRSMTQCEILRYQISTGVEDTLANPRARGVAPSVDEDGTVFYARVGRACGDGSAFVRTPVSGPTETLWRLPDGIEVATSDVSDPNDNGQAMVVFDRYQCRIPLSADLWGWEQQGSPRVTVTLNGNGRGRVVSTPAGIDCGTDCTKRFPSGTEVLLTADPAPSSEFGGWGGACSGTNRTCRVTILQATGVSASFRTGDGPPTSTTATTTDTTTDTTTTTTDTTTTTTDTSTDTTTTTTDIIELPPLLP